LKRRLGLGVVSDVETARLNEALQSGLYRALIDGIPGIAYDVYMFTPPRFRAMTR
jgi:hypothetical protein